MRIIIPMLMYAIACAEAPEAPEAPPCSEDTVTTMDSDITRIDSQGMARWVDSRYNVVCYLYTTKDLECFPISVEGTVQRSLDFQNQADDETPSSR